MERYLLEDTYYRNNTRDRNHMIMTISYLGTAELRSCIMTTASRKTLSLLLFLLASHAAESFSNIRPHRHFHRARTLGSSSGDRCRDLSRNIVVRRGEDDGTGSQEGDPYDDLKPDFEFDAATLTLVGFGLIAFQFFVVANL